MRSQILPPRKNAVTAIPGEWDRAANCWNCGTHLATVSIGCFQWAKRSSSVTCKRGKVQKRLHGPNTFEGKEALLKSADAYCDQRNTER
jgi:hypothetical protein